MINGGASYTLAQIGNNWDSVVSGALKNYLKDGIKDAINEDM